MRVLITGSRSFTDLSAVLDAVNALKPRMQPGERLSIIHGAAQGADQLARMVAEILGANEYRFPAEWERYGKAAGPLRNQDMLDTIRPDVVLAFPGLRSVGTMDMIARAKAAGIETIVHPID